MFGNFAEKYIQNNMAELVMRVRAEYESAVQCRKELDELVKKMEALNENSSPKEIERLTKRYAELTAKWENSMSFIGKAGAYMKETLSGVHRIIENNTDATKDLGTTTKSVIDNAQKRLQLENNILDSLKKQKDEAEKSRSSAAEGFNRNQAKLTNLEGRLKKKYNGQDEGFYDEADIELLERGRESVQNWKQAWEDANTKVLVYDQMIEDSHKRTEQLGKAIGEVTNVYKGFADTVSSTSQKLFISEDVYNRYHELEGIIDDLKQKIRDAGSGPDVDLVQLQDLQSQLEEAQAEFRALDEAARNTAAVLGRDLAEKTEKALEKFYKANDDVRTVTEQVKDFEDKLKQAKKELTEAKDPAAVTKAREEIDKLAVSLDKAKDDLTKFTAIRKDAVEEVKKLEKEISGGGGPGGTDGPDITDAVSSQVKGMMGTIASIAGIGLGLNELKDFFLQAKQWREYFQDIESSMKVFLGSAEKGAEFTAKLKDYAYYNKFEFSDLAAASQQMISYGHNVESIIPRLDQLSNVATGTHGSLMELVDTYNRAKATGVVDARGIQSWAVKGVMIKDTLREMGEVTAGTTITFEQLNKVLDKVTGEGGQFHNLMLEMMDNISAESGQLEDNLAAMYEEVGSKFEGVFVKFLKLQSAMAAGRSSFVSDGILDWGADTANAVLDDLLENWERYLGLIKDMVAAYGIYRAALIANNALEKASAMWKKLNADAITYKELATKKETAAKIAATAAEGANTGATNLNTGAKVANAKATDMLSLAMVRLRTAMMTHPFALVVAGLAAVAYAVYSAYDSMMTTEKAQRLLNTASEEFNESMKEQEQLDRDHIGTIKNQTASLLAQTKAYKQLIAERSIFAKFSKDDIAKMSQEQINTLLAQDTDNQNEKRIRAQVDAAKELQSMFKGKGAAWAYAEEEDIDEVVSKFGLLPEYAKQLKESIGSMTDLSDWADKLVLEAENELQAHLSENAESGIIEGFKNGFGSPEIQMASYNAISAFSAQMEAKTADIEKEILSVQAQIAKIDNLNTDSTAKEHKIQGLTNKLKILSTQLTTVKKGVSDTFVAQMQPQLEQAQKTVDELNQQLISASGTKRTEIETKLNDANNDLSTVKSIMSYFEASVTNKELVINIREQVEDTMLGDEKLVEIGNAYKEVENEAVKYLDKVDEIREKMVELGVVTEQEAQNIASDHKFTADAVTQSFGRMYSDISKSIEDLDRELKNTTDPNRQNEINLEIKEKQKLLDYIDNLKTNLLELANNPFELRLNVIGKAEGWLKDLLKKAGYNLDEGTGKQSGWGSTDFAQRGLRQLGINGTDTYRQNSEEAQEKAIQAQERIEEKNKKGPDKFTGKQWRAKEIADLRSEIRKTEDLLKTKLTQVEAENAQKQLDGYKSRLKQLTAEGKKGADLNAKRIADELKYQEKLKELRKQGSRAAIDAQIAQEKNDYLREKKQRDEQHRRTVEDLQDYTDIYKSIYEQRRRDYELSHKDSKYENTPEGRDGYLTEDSQTAIRSSLTKKEQELFNAEVKIRQEKINKAYAEEGNKEAELMKARLQSMRDYLKEYGTFQQQKLAIEEKYADEIRELDPTDEWGMRIKEEQKKAELNAIDVKILEQNIDWSVAFDGFSDAFQAEAKATLDNIEKYMQTKEFAEKDAASKAEFVRLRNELSGKTGSSVGTFNFSIYKTIGEQLKEYQQKLLEAKQAEEEHNKATTELLEAQKQLKEAEDAAKNATDNQAAQLAVDNAKKNVAEKQHTFNTTKKTFDDKKGNANVAKSNLQKSVSDAKKAIDNFGNALKQLTNGTLRGFVDGLINLYNAITGNGLTNGVLGIGSLFKKTKNNENTDEDTDASGKAKGLVNLVTGSDKGGTGSDKGGTGSDKGGTGSDKGGTDSLDKVKEVAGSTGETVGMIIAAILDLVDMIGSDPSQFFDDLFQSIMGFFQGIFEQADSGELAETIAHGISDLFSSLLTQAYEALDPEVLANNIEGIGRGFANGLTGFAMKDNHASQVKEQERVRGILEDIDERVSNIAKQMGDSYGGKAIGLYADAVEQYGKKTFAYWTGLNAAGTDNHGTKHSYWYHFNKNSANQANALAQTYGLTATNDWQGFFIQLANLGTEGSRILDDIRTNHYDFWSSLISQDSDGDIRQWLTQWADSWNEFQDLTENFKEQMAGTTLDNVFSGFMDDLYSMADGAEDVFETISDDYQKMVNRMAINNILGQEMRDNIKKWYDRFASAYDDRSLTESELASLRDEYNRYVQEGAAKVEELRKMGLISAVDSNNEQSATANSIQNISYDQADAMEGTLIAQLIVQEQIKAILESGMGYSTPTEGTLLDASSSQLLAYSMEHRDIAADSRDILAGMAIHVEQIRDGVVDTIVPRIKNIDNNLNKVYKIVEAQ